MIKDLARLEADASVSTEVLIIGGGIAGLLLAVKLREHDVPVVILESGGPGNDAQPHPLNEVVQFGRVYRGALEGRARGLGGTSALWGGALIPFLAEDMQARPHAGAVAWPVGLNSVAPHIDALERLFGLDKGAFDERFVTECKRRPPIPVGDTDFIARFAKWPAFGRRNVATLFRKRIESDPGLTVFLNATVTSFVLDESAGRLSGAQASHTCGKSLRIGAQRVVVCAGAIEATRLLLLLDRQTHGRAFAGCDALGRYFHDHVSTRAASIVTSRPLQLNRLAGFRFAASTMRSLRFELTPGAQQVAGVGSAFGHISFQVIGASGFDHLRTLLRDLQRTRRIDLDAAAKLAIDAPYLVRAAYWRYVHKQLRWPEPAVYELHIVAEQKAKPENRIVLAEQTDPLGVPRAAVDWRIASDDCATIGAYASRFDAYWKRHKLDGLGRLDWAPGIRHDSAASIEQIGDVFHPGGTTRMGSNAREAIVDGNLNTFSIANLWVASTSVFPSGASANPTMMLMLFTLRLADHLVKASR